MQKIVVSWRDIPSQVIVKKGRQRAKVLLSSRFQQAVDRAAMRARKHSEDAYMSEWVRARSGLDQNDPLVNLQANPQTDRQADVLTDLQAIADGIAQDIETSYSDERLLVLIKNHGLAGR